MRANDTIHAHDRGTIHPHATQHVRGRLRQRVGVRAPFDRSELRPLAIGHHARLGAVGHALGGIGDVLRILGGLIRLADLRRETGSRLVRRLGDLPDGIQILGSDLRVDRAA